MRTLFVGLGLLAILVGIVWVLQGANVLMGSAMSGSTFWLGMGVLLLVIGAAAAVFGARSPRANEHA
jgi:hypothetical protein